MSGADQDVTALRKALGAAESARDDALTELRELQGRQQDDRREAQHHLRNFMSVIRAIARRTAEDAEDVESYCAVLMALAIHDLVSALITSGRAEEAAFALRLEWQVASDDGSGSLVVDWIESISDARERPDASAWHGWIEEAIKYQLGGAISERISATEWSRQFRLPASCYAVESPVTD